MTDSLGPSEMEALLARLESFCGERHDACTICGAAAAIRQLIAERDEALDATLVSLVKKDEWWEREHDRLAAQLTEAQGQIARLREALTEPLSDEEASDVLHNFNYGRSVEDPYGTHKAVESIMRRRLAATAPQEPTP